MDDSFPVLALMALNAVLFIAVIADAIGGWQFWPACYTAGILVLREDDVSLPLPSAAIETGFETENGKFKLIAADRILLRQRFGFGRSRGQLRGAITWIGGCARVEARMPLTFALTFVVMAAFLVAIGLRAGFPSELFIFIPMMVVVIWANVAWERRMIRRILDEYRQSLLSATAHA